MCICITESPCCAPETLLSQLYFIKYIFLMINKLKGEHVGFPCTILTQFCKFELCQSKIFKKKKNI